MEWNLVSIEEEIEREKARPEINPNLVSTPSKKLGCGRIFLYLFLGILLFRLITQIFS